MLLDFWADPQAASVTAQMPAARLPQALRLFNLLILQRVVCHPG